MSPVARSRTEGSEMKLSPVRTAAAKVPVRAKCAQLRGLRIPSDPRDYDEKVEVAETETSTSWTDSVQPQRSGIVSGIMKRLSPKCDRRGADSKKAEQLENLEEEDKSNGGGGSPIYHELDPPGTCRFAVQHTYQSIVEIGDELESLKTGSVRRETATADLQGKSHQLSRTKSAQELTQKSPTKLSLFSRFRFATKKSSTKKVCPPDDPLRGQSSLQDVDLITRSRDEEGVASSHDRQPSFTTFAHGLPRVGTAACDADGYSTVYVPRNLSERANVCAVAVPPRSSSLIQDSLKLAPEPLYKQKFLKIASVHTLQSPTVADDRVHPLTSSNSVGDLLSATDIGQPSPRRVTSYDDHAVSAGSRKMAAPLHRRADSKSLIARFALSPGRCAAFASPSCGIRMAEMRGAVRRCTNDVSTSPTASAPRSPSACTPLPSPGRLTVFQFSVPPPGVMMSPPVQRAYRHVSSQTVMSVRPPSAACVLTATAVQSPGGGPPGQMQTIEEEDDDFAIDDLKSTSTNLVPAEPHLCPDDRSLLNGFRERTVVSGDVGQPRDNVVRQNGGDNCRPVEDESASSRRTQSEMKTSKLRRPSPIVASKTVTPGCTSSPLSDHHPSRIVPPSVTAHKRTESSSVSPPSTPRSVDPQPRSGSARAELARRPAINRVPHAQQKRKQLPQPPADVGDGATISVTPVGDGLSVPGVRKQGPRRWLAPADGPGSANGSPNLSSDSSVSLLSAGSDADVLSGTGVAPEPGGSEAGARTLTTDARSLLQHKHSTPVATRVGKFTELTIPARTDRRNY